MLKMVWRIAAISLLLCAFAGADIIDVEFDLVTQDYWKIYEKLHKIYSNNVPALDVEGHAFLAPTPTQDPRTVEPARWVRTRFRGEDGDVIQTLTRFDNLYFLGFSNFSDHWRHANGWKSHFDSLGFNPPPIALDFSESYPGIFGKLGHKGLATIPLGKAAALNAVRVLSRCNPSTTTQQSIKTAYAQISIMFSEALRIVPIRQRFSHDWATAEGPSFLTLQEADYAVCWGLASYNLRKWKENNKHWATGDAAKKLRNVCGVYNPQDALDLLDLLLRRIDV